MKIDYGVLKIKLMAIGMWTCDGSQKSLLNVSWLCFWIRNAANKVTAWEDCA